MQKRIKLTFVDRQGDSIQPVLIPRTNVIADLWYNKLKNFLPIENGYIETRFSGFKLQRRNLPILIEKLQRCVDGINNSWLNKEYGYKIEVDKIPADYPTQVHNIIHHHFEILMGQTWNPSEWYDLIVNKKKDPEVFTFVRGLNDLSHEIEELKVDKTFPHLHTTFMVEDTFNNQPVEKDELPVEVEDYFELGNHEGVAYLQYAQLGKTWQEVIHDEDEEIFESNISPLRLLSGEFSLCFRGDGFSHTQHLNYLTPKLKALGKDPKDKSLRLGRVIVADIEYTKGLPALIYDIENGYDQLYSIEVENQLKVLPPYLDPY